MEHCWIAGHDSKGRDILAHDGACRHESAATNLQARQNEGACADENVIFNFYRAIATDE